MSSPEEKLIRQLNRDRIAFSNNNVALSNALQVAPSPLMILASRVEGLIDMLYGDFDVDEETNEVTEGTADRVRLEIACHKKMTEFLEGAAGAVQAAREEGVGGLVLPDHVQQEREREVVDGAVRGAFAGDVGEHQPANDG